MTKANLTALDLWAVIPLALSPLIYGLAPNIFGPFLLLLSWMVACSIILPAPWRKIGPTGFLICLVALSVYFIHLNQALTSQGRESSLAILAALWYVFSLLIYSRKNPQKMERLVSWAILAGAYFVGCVALGILLLLPRAKFWNLLLGNSNILGAYCALTLSLAAVDCWRRPRGKESLLYLPVMILSFLMMSFSSSLGPWMALLITSAYFLWRYTKTKLPVVGSIVLIIFVAACLKFLSHSKSFVNRIAWQQAALSISYDHLLTGAALEGGFANLFPLYRPGFAQEGSRWTHNAYLEILSNWGLIGAGLLAAAMTALFKRTTRPWSLRLQWIWLFTAVIAFFESSLLLFPLLLIPLSLTATQTSSEEPKAGWPSGLIYWGAACFLAAQIIPLALGRAYLLKSGLWLNALTIMPEQWNKAKTALHSSLRWDWSNADTWMDLARLENALSRDWPLRQGYALAAARQSLMLEPYTKRSWAALKTLRVGAKIP